ncbi:MAG: hypothetical protein R3C29_04395 [Dehalococcoidia bacterium]
MTSEPVRLTDIFTNAAAIADYTGAAVVEPVHLLEAIEHLREGRPWQFAEDAPVRSPLGRSGQRAAVPAALRDLAQRWFKRLESDPLAELGPVEVEELKGEIENLGR